MRIEDLTYQTPETIGEACLLLSEGGRALAGGTDLLADLKQSRERARALVSLARIPGLREITLEDGGLRIGALVTPNRLAGSAVVREVLPALADAAAVMGGNQIRNLATIGGNLASAVPSADLPPSLLVAGASFLLASPEGERLLPADDFFLGPRRSALGPAEILVSVWIPAPATRSGSSYRKFQLRDASALAVVGVAALVSLEGEIVKNARVAVGAASPTPLLVADADAPLRGRAPDTARLAEVGRIAAAAVEPIDDLRGTKEYRRHLTQVLTVRALGDALARARGESGEAR